LIGCQYLAAFAGSLKDEGKAESRAIHESGVVMTYALNKKQVGVAVSCVLALGLLCNTAQAQTKNSGYVTDQRGNVVKSGTGLCWRTGYWTPADANAECDSDLMPRLVARAADPVPAPVPVLAPAAAAAPMPVAQRITLDADTLFDFDKSDLRPAGRTALDEFVAKIKTIGPETITVVGHTDRFGSNTYNQHLSERRAASVKAYLVSKGVEPARIQSEGKGETMPVTKAGECLGAKSAKVVACLQPDRRVEIEVVGTQIAR
jgi:OOP family OmpA-OmpF porin